MSKAEDELRREVKLAIHERVPPGTWQGDYSNEWCRAAVDLIIEERGNARRRIADLERRNAALHDVDRKNWSLRNRLTHAQNDRERLLAERGDAREPFINCADIEANRRLRHAWEAIARDIGRHDKASIAAALSRACAGDEDT